MALLHNLTKNLHREFAESDATALDRDQILSLLELLMEVAGQIDHLGWWVWVVKPPADDEVIPLSNPADLQLDCDPQDDVPFWGWRAPQARGTGAY